MFRALLVGFFYPNRGSTTGLRMMSIMSRVKKARLQKLLEEQAAAQKAQSKVFAEVQAGTPINTLLPPPVVPSAIPEHQKLLADPAESSVSTPKTAAHVPKQDQRSLSIAIIGAPNAGKSTLVNSIVGTKISAVSSKVQTTRERVVGVLTENDTQLVRQ